MSRRKVTQRPALSRKQGSPREAGESKARWHRARRPSVERCCRTHHNVPGEGKREGAREEKTTKNQKRRLRQRHGSGRHHTPPIVESRLRQRHGSGRHHTPSIVESQCKGKHKLQKHQCTFLHGRGKRKRRRDAQGLADMSVRRSRATEDKAQRVATSRRCHHGPDTLLPLLRSDRYMHAGFTSRSAEPLFHIGRNGKERKG